MKRYTFLLLLIPLLSLANIKQDSLSLQQVQNIQLKQDLESLKNQFETSERNLKDLQEEKVKQYQLQYEKLDSRVTNSIWTISILIALITALITFIGWNELKKSVKKYFNKQAKNLTSKRIDTILTEEWLSARVKDSAQQPISEAMMDLKKDFKDLSKRVLDDEKIIMNKYHY